VSNLSVEYKIIKLKILNLGEFEVKLHRVDAPKTIDRMWQALPLNGRAIKQGDRLIMPTELNTSKERLRTEFKRGDLSLDPSSGNLTIHIGNNKVESGENYLGKIEEQFNTERMPLTSTVLISAGT
jgi:hypothetical protein